MHAGEFRLGFVQRDAKRFRVDTEQQIAGRDPDKVDDRDIMSTHPRTKERVQQAIQVPAA